MTTAPPSPGAHLPTDPLSCPAYIPAGDLPFANHSVITDLIREAELLASMRHPNIVWTYGEACGVYAHMCGGVGVGVECDWGGIPITQMQGSVCSLLAEPPRLPSLPGIVLPNLPDKQPGNGSSDGSDGDSGGELDGGGSGGGISARGDMVDAIASGLRLSGMQPGMIRPPALVTGRFL